MNDKLTTENGSISRSPAVEKVLVDLREKIMLGEVTQEQQLAENALAAGYGVSRGSIRRALQTLENEGLVVASDNGRRTPVIIDEKFTNDLYQTRLMLETAAIQICLNKMDIDTSKIATAVADFYKLYSYAGEELYVARSIVNTRFHRAVIETAESQPLLQCWNTLEPLIHGIAKFNYIKLKERQTNDDLISSHQKLMDLIFKRDRKALQEIADHVGVAISETDWGLTS